MYFEPKLITKFELGMKMFLKVKQKSFYLKKVWGELVKKNRDIIFI